MGALASISGLNDYDYQNLSTLSMGMKQLNQLVTTNKVPIPPEIMDHFKRKRRLLGLRLPLLTHPLSLLPFHRHEMQLHDGTVPRDWSCLAHH